MRAKFLGYFILVTSFIFCSNLSLAASTLMSKSDLEHSVPHYAHVPNGVIEYYQFGKGSPIVLIAGYGSNVSSWDWRFLSDLASQHRVIIFDNRGISGSLFTSKSYTPQDLANDTYHLAQALHLHKPAVAGISMGGMIAQEYAVHYPNAISKLILINTAIAGPKSIAPPLKVQQMLFSQPKNKLGLFIKALHLFFPPNWRATMAAEILTDRFHSVYLEEKFPTDQVLLKQQALVKAFSQDNATAEDLKHLTVPVLILNGGSDIVIPPINANILAKTIPHSTLLRWAQGGHSMIFQFPYPIGDTINHFLR